MIEPAPDNFIALQRFGLGGRPGDLVRIGADPRGAVLAEITPAAPLIEDRALPDTAAALETIRGIQMQRRADRKADTAAAAAPDMTDGADAMAPEMAGEATPAAGSKKKTRKDKQAARDAQKATAMDKPGNPLAAELAARFASASAAPVGFAERWSMFWSNHFAVESDSNQLVRWLAGPYDREAIRPHVFGNFTDLLFAATRHPAMLRYLNNDGSIGPDSKAGQKRDKGLNENHARELMELHTIGVDAGYTQADVTSFAKVLTGWTFGQNPEQTGRFAQFVFNAAAHEPGPETVLGTSYAQKGVEQGEAVLNMLAAHPATATHIATKLVRHFVADEPPADLVAALATTFRDTEGDLAAVAKALVSADAAWAAPMTKLRLPQEYLLAAARALDLRPKPQQALKALATLGQPLFNPPSPEGFHDDVATWLAPDAMTNRLDVAQLLSAQADASADARAVADDILGAAQSDKTREAISRAEGPVQGLTILLMSPEFQRR